MPPNKVTLFFLSSDSLAESSAIFVVNALICATVEPLSTSRPASSQWYKLNVKENFETRFSLDRFNG
jgi:hypothetical protein